MHEGYSCIPMAWKANRQFVARRITEHESVAAAEAAAKSRELGAQLAAMQAEHGEMSAAAKDAEKARADEARASLAQLNETHQAELTSVKRQVLSLEDRCTSLTNEKTDLNRQLSEARKQFEADLLAAHTAAAAAESAAAAAGSGGAAAADAAPAAAAPPSPPPAAAPQPAVRAAVRQQSGEVDRSPQHTSVSAVTAAAGTTVVPRGAPDSARTSSAASRAAPEAGSATEDVDAPVGTTFTDSGVPPMPDAPAYRSAAVNGDTSLPSRDLPPIDVPRSAHREPVAGPPPEIDIPQVKGGMVVDWNDPDNVSVARQVRSACYHASCNTDTTNHPNHTSLLCPPPWTAMGRNHGSYNHWQEINAVPILMSSVPIRRAM